MRLSELLLWPGTKVCQRFGIDPVSDAGLLRWMVDTIVYLVLVLGVLCAVIA